MGNKKAIWTQLRAKYAVISNGISDLEHTFLGNAIIIDLWHGVPLKKYAMIINMKKLGQS